MFRLMGSPQKNAGPLQSFVKSGGPAFGQVTPNPYMSGTSPMTPTRKQPQWKSPMQAAKNMPFLEPLFVNLVGKYFGG